ncbi:helix-turn-helix transcriptional regulator [Streptomyces cavourensis]
MADHHPIHPTHPIRPVHPARPTPSSPDALSPQGRGRPPSAFGQALREARERKGLTLARLRDHLARRGVRVSTVTLSHWQRGRSQPERAESLRAVSAIESILGCPAGGLLALLGPRRPRGRPRRPRRSAWRTPARSTGRSRCSPGRWERRSSAG